MPPVASGRTALRPQRVVAAAALIVSCVVLAACRRQAESPSTPQSSPPPAQPGLPARPLVNAAAKGTFVGSDACKSCHQDQFRDHLLTTHADTLQQVAAGGKFAAMFKTAQRVDDPALGISYSLALKQGVPYFRAIRREDGAVEESRPAYAVGSGRMGYTFLVEQDGRFFESRLSYYPHARTWSWTAGQQVVERDQPLVGRVLDVQRTQECFLCHSTAVVHEDGLVQPGKSLFNVGCERCHGPGREHAELARQGKPRPLGPQYGKVSAASVVELCKSCHGQPRESMTVSAMDGSLPRFAGTAFSQSKCFTESKGRLSCVTCHEPHQPLKKETVSYEKVCLSCHSAPEPDGVCPIEPTTGCVGCHMPLQSAGLPLDFKFHNHWIKTKYPRPAPSP